MQWQEQCLKNLSAVLEAAGSSLQNVVRVGVFLTTMENFAAMNCKDSSCPESKSGYCHHLRLRS